MTNKKNFNIYIFLSSFSRNLIEVFIGTILLKKGFSLHSVIFYFLLVNLFSVLFAPIATLVAKRYSNKLLSLFGILCFIILQFVLNYIDLNVIYLYIIALLYAFYRRSYWISRRYYTLQIVDDKKNISKSVSFISIINQLAVMVSSYIGSVLLEFFDVSVVTVISISLFILSSYFLYKLKFEYEKNTTPIKIFEILKETPISSIIHIGCFEVQNVFSFLLPLYLIIYVKDSYTTIGIIKLITNISTLLFTYFYGRLINKNKNYLKCSILFITLIHILEINVMGIFLMIISFIEGLVSKMYEQSFDKEYLTLSKKFEYHNYNFMYEMIQNISRFIVILIIFLFIKDLKVMLYFTILFTFVCILFEFKYEPKNNNSEVVWKE